MRVGGSFVWRSNSSAELNVQSYGTAAKGKKVVFVAGGVGINPLMSMLSSIGESRMESLEVELLYSVKVSKDPKNVAVSEILFLERLADLFRTFERGLLKLFLTGTANGDGSLEWQGGRIAYRGRRIMDRDLEEALGSRGVRKETVCYVCGVPEMTDSIVGWLSRAEGMSAERVFCEKWW